MTELVKSFCTRQVIMSFMPGSRERSQDFLLKSPVIPRKMEYSGESTAEELELPSYDFSSITLATDNFSEQNKLGRGGFGSVYKVCLNSNSRNAHVEVEFEFKIELFDSILNDISGHVG